MSLVLFYSPQGRAIDIGLLSENHHKINLYVGEGFSIKWRCCLLFVVHFLHHLIEHIDPQLAIMIGQS